MAAAILPAVPDRQKKIGTRESRWLGRVVFLVLWGLITHGTHAGTGDEPHYQMIAHSLAFEGDVDLTTDYANPANRALGGLFEGGAHIQPGRDGRLRPVHDIGMPLLFAPYYRLAYAATEEIVARVPARWLVRARLNFTVLLRHLMSFAMIGLTAWMAVRLFALLSPLSASPRRAFAWALLLVLSPPILSHSFLFFTEILSAVIALLVFMWLREAKPEGSVSGDGWLRRGRVEAVVAGAAVGFLLLVHARNAGLIVGLLLLAVIRSRRWPDRALLPAFLGGAAMLFAVRTGVTYHLWGTWLTTPHARLGAAGGWQPVAAESATRLAGWLFDQEHGLLFYAPIYVLAPAGWFALRRRDRELCTAISLVAGCYVAVMTAPFLNAHGWRGGWTPAARFLVPIAPFLAVLAFAAVAHLPRLPAIVFVLAGVQVGLDLTLWQQPGLLWNEGIGTSALLAYLDGGTGWLSAYAPSVFTPLGARALLRVAVATLACAIFTAWFVRRFPAQVEAPAARPPGSPQVVRTSS